MIEDNDITGTIRSVVIRSDDDCAADWLRNEHAGYEIVIETDRGTWCITGCHDMGPDCQEVNK